ncbi:hypothetical protein GGTG_10633 [Gaeumannomyces tritici R3-111a-1]|uniref:Uncharacterized protein n=1 Tax=Gaeumannomyces tritici (strain R3-111a-1) TaxID=644352 RepID=J3PAV8_GAET3|nr:hypothetical protein GGTG_10633 [Gaeumannomyces tritici R3-111a-1]EJT71374.1 hypothetical protein GGTG_10633 [Gaeumannomyces tritici R3-111a-1]
MGCGRHLGPRWTRDPRAEHKWPVPSRHEAERFLLRRRGRDRVATSVQLLITRARQTERAKPHVFCPDTTAQADPRVEPQHERSADVPSGRLGMQPGSQGDRRKATAPARPMYPRSQEQSPRRLQASPAKRPTSCSSRCSRCASWSYQRDENPVPHRDANVDKAIESYAKQMLVRGNRVVMDCEEATACPEMGMMSRDFGSVHWQQLKSRPPRPYPSEPQCRLPVRDGGFAVGVAHKQAN